MGRRLVKVGLGIIFLWVGTGLADAVDFSKVRSPTNRTLSSVFMSNAGDGWAVGDGGVILHWNGTDWQRRTSPTTSLLKSVCLVNPLDGWAVGRYGTILRWNGTVWSSVASPTGWGIHSVSMVGPDDGWAVGYRGAILRWTGTSWRLGISPTWETLSSVNMVAQNDGWAVGNMGTIVHWNGTQWRTVASPTATNLLSVAMANDDSGWAVGKAGTIVRWNGTAWSREPSPTEEDLLSVHMLNEDTGWAVGGDGTVIHYNGAVWELASSPTDAILSSVFAPDEENVWVVGVGGSILKWTGRDQAQRIMVDPPSLDYGAVPVDYPSLWNFTRIANPGTEPLNVESVTLVEDGAGVFSLLGAIVDELLVGPEFGDPSRLGPFTLGPGGDLSIWINYQTITADIEDYQGRIEIVSDDPFEPVVEVELLASSTTASGASIYYRQEVLYRSEVDRPFFSAQVDMDATVTGWEVFNDQNVEDCTARVSEDTSLVIVEGKVKDPDYYARMTLEVTYENSSEKLAIVDILISPYLATKASIETCDSTGNPKDDFDPGERVYLSGKGLAASTEYVVSIVPDSDIWITGMPIKGIPDVSSRLSSDEEGAIPPAALWDTIQSDGEYDILLDINGNGLYDGGVDPIDNSDDGSTGGFAIPELLIVSALLTLLRVHLSKFRRADPREPTC